MNDISESVEQKIIDAGFENVVVFSDYGYDDALIGISDDNRAIYDYDLMIKWLMDNDGFTDTEAIEWIEFNTLRALPYVNKSPIIMYRL